MLMKSIFNSNLSRAPDLGFLSEFEHSFNVDLMASYHHVIVMGDFNCDLGVLGPDKYYTTHLSTLFHSSNLSILPTTTTQHTSTASTWMNVMAVADPDHTVHHGQYPAPGL